MTSCFMFSCSDWLETDPSSTVVSDDFWDSKESVESAIIAIYQSMQGSETQRMFLWGEIRADMITAGNNPDDELRYILEGDIDVSNSVVDWATFYKTINYCNTVLDHAPDVMDADETYTQTELNANMGEAYGMRALLYFYLVRSFRDVPLITWSYSTDDEDFFVSKNEEAEIYPQIISDLKKSIAMSYDAYDTNDETKGRLTSYAARAILSEVYLWTDAYDSCQAQCDTIINSNQYGLLEGDNSWFSTMYGEGNCSESIFELNFDDNCTNPLYNLIEYSSVLQLCASDKTIDELFLIGEDTEADSIDIRSDGASYKSSRSNCIWKYLGWNSSTVRSETEFYPNYIFYRYADVLLLKAEALILQGETADALELIKKVRNRANADEATEQEPTTTKDCLEYLLDERAREFAFEGKRWYDVLRVSRHEDNSYTSYLYSMVKNAAPSQKRNTVLAKYQDENYRYFPIYQDEMEVNPNLVQNPYWAE